MSLKSKTQPSESLPDLKLFLFMLRPYQIDDKGFLVSKITKFRILMVSITLGFILFPIIVSAQLTQQQLEVDKLEREIELLDQQIKNSKSDPYNILISQIITILGGIGIAGFTAIFAIQRERRIPPTMEQERIIQDIIKE